MTCVLTRSLSSVPRCCFYQRPGKFHKFGACGSPFSYTCSRRWRNRSTMRSTERCLSPATRLSTFSPPLRHTVSIDGDLPFSPWTSRACLHRRARRRSAPDTRWPSGSPAHSAAHCRDGCGAVDDSLKPIYARGGDGAHRRGGAWIRWRNSSYREPYPGLGAVRSVDGDPLVSRSGVTIACRPRATTLHDSRMDVGSTGRRSIFYSDSRAR